MPPLSGLAVPLVRGQIGLDRYDGGGVVEPQGGGRQPLAVGVAGLGQPLAGLIRVVRDAYSLSVAVYMAEDARWGEGKGRPLDATGHRVDQPLPIARCGEGLTHQGVVEGRLRGAEAVVVRAADRKIWSPCTHSVSR